MEDNTYLAHAAYNLFMGISELEKDRDVLSPEMYELLKDMYFDAAERWGMLNTIANC